MIGRYKKYIRDRERRSGHRDNHNRKIVNQLILHGGDNYLDNNDDEIRPCRDSTDGAVGVVRRCADDRRIGTIVLKREHRGSSIHIDIQDGSGGLTDGKHGFHLHRCGDERNSDRKCTSMCEHYNRRGQPNQHGGLFTQIRHSGDLGNIESKNGIIKTMIWLNNNQLKIEECIGRSFIVHAGEDDLGKGGNEASKITGNSGARYAYAIVGML